MPNHYTASCFVLQEENVKIFNKIEAIFAVRSVGSGVGGGDSGRFLCCGANSALKDRSGAWDSGIFPVLYPPTQYPARCV